jgi:hypothetical protein
MKDRVVIIGDVSSGFRVHGMFSDNAEACAYVERHAERIPDENWKGNALAIKIVNFDTMSQTEVSEYEDQVGGEWANLKEDVF